MAESSGSERAPSDLPSLSTASPDTVLRLGRCFIRQHRKGDAEAISKQADNPNVAKCMSDAWPHPYTVEDARKRISLILSTQPPRIFIISRLEDNAAIGEIGLHEMDGDSTTMLLGYWLGEEHWGQGIMTEVVAAFTRWNFDHVGYLQCIEARVHVGNGMSSRVLEKAGFVFRERKTNAVRKGALDVDVLVYSVARAYHPRNYTPGCANRAMNFRSALYEVKKV